jgi:hypothetical protein
MSASDLARDADAEADTPFGHLNLREWPFSVVPSDRTAVVWIGREALQRKLRALLRTVGRVPASRIVLFWAAYGQGKTHALLHLKQLVAADRHVRALYVVTPQGIRSFVDVYRAIIESALADGVLDDLGLAIYARHQAQAPTDLQRALVRLVTFEEGQSRSALNWLKAERVPARDLRESQLSRAISNSADGIEILNELVGLLRTELQVRLLVMLDEIQELGGLKPRQLEEAVGGLHKVFDRNTEGLTLLFCFTTAYQGTAARIIGETLYERRSELLTLAALTEQEGVELIEGLIKAWSIDLDRAPFPFTHDAVVAVVRALAAGEDDLTPRGVIRAFDAILRAGDLAIEDGEVTQIDTELALAEMPAFPEAQ